jgi:hypothetical protein
MSPSSGAIPLSLPLDGAFRALPADRKEPFLGHGRKDTASGGSAWRADVRRARRSSLSAAAGRSLRNPVGLAWTRLKEKWLEADFGKRVALNSIAKDQILEIRAEQFFAKFHIANERASRAAQVDDFSLDPGRDVVASIEGVSAEVGAGGPIRGATSLRLNTCCGFFCQAGAGYVVGDELHAALELSVPNLTGRDGPCLILQCRAEVLRIEAQESGMACRIKSYTVLKDMA